MDGRDCGLFSSLGATKLKRTSFSLQGSTSINTDHLVLLFSTHTSVVVAEFTKRMAVNCLERMAITLKKGRKVFPWF